MCIRDRCSSWSPISALEIEYLRGRFGENVQNRVTRLRKPHECPTCNGRGFSGRIPIFEAITVTDGLRATIQAGFDEFAFENAAIKEGAQTLIEDGMERVVQGVTSLDELLSAVGS